MTFRQCKILASQTWRLLGPLGPIAILIWIIVAVQALSHPIFPTLKLDGPFKHRIYGRVEAEVVRVKDGDTLSVNIKEFPPLVGHEVDVRVYGVDTAELSDGGAAAKTYVQQLLPTGTKIVLDDMRRGKYFRIVAEVVLPEGLSLRTALLEEGLAYEYYGGTKRKESSK